MFNKRKQQTTWGLEDVDTMDLNERKGSRLSSPLNDSKTIETTSLSKNSITVAPQKQIEEKKINIENCKPKITHDKKNINSINDSTFEMQRKIQVEKFDKILRLIGTSWFICATSLAFVSIYGYTTSLLKF